MNREDQIEIIARGVCQKRNKLLLCHSRGASNTYLPGGHVEFGERARESLCREIEEELGVVPKIKRFLGAVEHRFTQKGEEHCEINLIFEMDIPGIDSSSAPVSMEGYIEFRWIPMRSLCKSRVEPRVLIRLLRPWLRSRKGVQRWASAF